MSATATVPETITSGRSARAEGRKSLRYTSMARSTFSRPRRSPMTRGSPAAAATAAPSPIARTYAGMCRPSAGRACTWGWARWVPSIQPSSSARRPGKSSASSLPWPSARRTPSVNPTERPSPMSIRPGKREASTPNCSATTSGWWLGSITPPVPTRMVEVAPATAAARTVGADPATPGTLWCSETQKRW
ncbi:hypothetical protein SMICM304S_05231 [Streptomyces microflavus]